MIRILLFTLLITLIYHHSNGQKTTTIAQLPPEVFESSGLIYINNKIITHNDSGDSPTLYILNIETGFIEKKVHIKNARNNDWEDICHDDTYIYIADIGNNYGSRKDLKVYRILISDLFSEDNEDVSAEIISLAYDDQTDFTANRHQTNYDAEAIIALDDMLYIFTKNWVDNNTNIYPLPKEPGDYSINKIHTLNVQGLITGGCYNTFSNKIMLCGYNFLDPFVVELTNFKTETILMERTILEMPTDYSLQVEAIAPINQNEYYLSTENSFSGAAGLFRYTASIALAETANNCEIKYLSKKNIIKTECILFSRSELYSIHGGLVSMSNHPHLDTSTIDSGLYIFVVKDSNNKIKHTQKVIIQ